MKKQFLEKCKQYITSKYGYYHDFSDSQIYKWRGLVRDGEDLESVIDKTMNRIMKLNNYPYYWMSVGASIEESMFYAKNIKKYKFIICNWCNKIFAKKDGVKTCCCQEHFDLHKERWAKNLSESRKKYNNRDPKQYAEYHNISLEEATNIVSKTVREGSHFTIDHWIKRGYTLEEAKDAVSKVQSGNSQRHKDHWIKRGYTLEEAKDAVSKVQSGNSLKRLEKYNEDERRMFSSFYYGFWMNRGFSEEESKKIVRDISASGTDAYLRKYTIEERRTFNPNCTEYWIKKYPDNWEVKYVDYINKRQNCCYRSKIADEFSLLLSQKFLGDKLYFGENEFGVMMCQNKYIRIDFVNLSKMFCVEFLGDYWHANPDIYSKDEKISYPNSVKKLAEDIWIADQTRFDYLRNIGFDVYTIWESDYKKDMKKCIETLYEEITKNENKINS